jgi:hypothetical protein
VCDRATGSDSRELAVLDSNSRERDVTRSGHAKDAEVAARAAVSRERDGQVKNDCQNDDQSLCDAEAYE